jgi:O-antigen/teichoic acid export membrane protein
MKTLAIGRILGMAVYLLFVMGMVSNSLDLCWVPFAWCFGFLVQTIYYLSSYKKLCISNDSKKRPLRLFETIKQGIPLGSASLISQVIIQFPFIYLGFFDSTVNAGLYSVAFRVVVLMLVIDRVFYTIFFPAVSRSFKDSLKHLKERVDWTLKIVTTCSLYLAILALIAGRDLLPVIFGPDFHGSGLIFRTLLGYFVLTVINSIFTFTLIGIEKERLYTKSLLIGAVVFAVVILIPFPLTATLTIPIALAIHQAVSMLMMMKYLRQSIPINSFFRVLLPLLVATIFALYIGLWQNLYPVLVPITAVVFGFPAIAIASGINRNDINTLKGLVK